MLKYVFIIITTCKVMALIPEGEIKSHVITFRFGKLSSFNISLIKHVEITWENRNGYDCGNPVNASISIDQSNGLHIIVENFFNDINSLENTYCISFFDLSGAEVFKGVFRFEKSDDNTLYMYSIKSRTAINTLITIFHKFLSNQFEKDESFSIIPNSSILTTNDFFISRKGLLERYFDKHAGLKETLDSLNECLSQIKEKKDISVQINNFINDRRANLIKVNDRYAEFERLRSGCCNVEFNLVNLLIDILKLLKSYAEETGDSSVDFILKDHDVYVSIKEVKVYEMPDTIRLKKGSKLQLQIHSDGNLDSYDGKDIWFLNDRLYISQNFCNDCCEMDWFLEVFNLQEKTKSMLLNLNKTIS